jgi:signal transduction histidine kinase
MKQMTLARQFMLVSLLILVGAALLIGAGLGQEIARVVTHRTAALTGLYVDSYLSAHLQELAFQDRLHPESQQALDSILTGTSLGRQIVSFKIWSREGTLVFSRDPSLIGRRFAENEKLEIALSGDVTSHLTNLDEPEQAYERQFWSRLIESYAPVYSTETDEIIAVSEFYQLPDDLLAEISLAQRRGWVLVILVMSGVFLVLAGIVGRASRTIVGQRSRLEDNVRQLRELLAENRELDQRVRLAAARTTALNERYLRRISADLHDGPAQALALAMLNMDSLDEAPVVGPTPFRSELRAVRRAIEAALAELRSISAGLRLPEIGPLSVAETVARAVRDFELKSHSGVNLVLSELPAQSSFPLKITLYRIITEALSNGRRHGGGRSQQVTVQVIEGELRVEIRDEGLGFDPKAQAADGHLGLAAMRERVQLLGGRLSVTSAVGQGTTVTASLPLSIPGSEEAESPPPGPATEEIAEAEYA